MSPLKMITLGIVFLVAMIVFFGTYYTVEEYEMAVLTRFGEVVSVEGKGLHFKLPFVNSVETFRTDIHELSPKQALNTYTVDNQEVDVTYKLFYSLPPTSDGMKYVYKNARNYKTLLESMAVDRIKVAMGKINLQHVSEKRGELRDIIRTTMATDARTIGVSVTDFQLTNLEYTNTFKAAVDQAAQAKAQVETRQQELEQEKLRADSVRTKAKGEADAQWFQQEVQIKSIRERGLAEAQAIKAKQDAIAQSAQLVEYEKALRWNGQLPQNMYAGAPIPFLNIPQGK